VCRFVGIVPGILGLVWPSFKPKSGSKSKIPGRILKQILGSFSSAEKSPEVLMSCLAISYFQSADRPHFQIIPGGKPPEGIFEDLAFGTVMVLIQTPLRSGQGAWVSVVFLYVLGGFPLVSGRLSYPPGPILGSVFLWRCFCRRKPLCSPSPSTLQIIRNIIVAQTLCPEGLWGPRLCNKSAKNVWGRRLHTFSSL
jgi:hypothetical protein